MLFSVMFTHSTSVNSVKLMNVSENQTVAPKIVPPDISFEKALETFARSADQSGRTWD